MLDLGCLSAHIGGHLSLTTDIDAIDSFFEGDRDALSSWTDNLHGSEFDPDDVFADPRLAGTASESPVLQEPAGFGGGAEHVLAPEPASASEMLDDSEALRGREDLWDLTFDDEKEIDVHPGLSLNDDPLDDFQVEVPEVAAEFEALDLDPAFADAWEA